MDLRKMCRRFGRREHGNEALQTVMVLGVAAIVLSGVLRLWAGMKPETEQLMTDLFEPAGISTSSRAHESGSAARRIATMAYQGPSADSAMPDDAAAAGVSGSATAFELVAPPNDEQADPASGPSGGPLRRGRMPRDPGNEPPESEDPAEAEEEEKEDSDEPEDGARRPRVAGDTADSDDRQGRAGREDSKLPARQSGNNEDPQTPAAGSEPSQVAGGGIPFSGGQDLGGGVQSGGGFPNGGFGANPNQNAGFPGSGFGGQGGFSQPGRNPDVFRGTAGADWAEETLNDRDRTDRESDGSRRDRRGGTRSTRSQRTVHEVDDALRSVLDSGAEASGSRQAMDTESTLLVDETQTEVGNAGNDASNIDPVSSGTSVFERYLLGGEGIAASGAAGGTSTSPVPLTRRPRPDEFQILDVDRDDPRVPRLIVKVGQQFQQIQVKAGDTHLAFAAPAAGSTNSVPLTAALLQPGNVLQVMAVNNDQILSHDFVVPEIQQLDAESALGSEITDEPADSPWSSLNPAPENEL
jgi:hypothetical protein